MKKLLFISLFFTFFIAERASARQGTIRLPATGQPISYHPVDDGDLRKGAPLPANRFINHGNGSATDPFTNLKGGYWSSTTSNFYRWGLSALGANVLNISFTPGSTTGFCCGANGQFRRILIRASSCIK